MKLVSFAALCLLLLSVEVALLPLFDLSVARPDVAVVMVVFLALRAQPLEGAVGSALAGYFVDVLSGQPSGLYVFTAVLVFLVCRLVVPFVEVRSAWGFALVLLGVDALHNLLAYGLLAVATSGNPGRAAMLHAVPKSAMLTAVSALLLFRPLHAVDALFNKPESGGLLL